MMKVIYTENAPTPVGAYSQAIKIDSSIIVFCSGQLGIKPGESQLISDNVEEQTLQVFENIREVVRAAGLPHTNIVKVNIFLTDLNDFGIVNKIFGNFFDSHKPARSTVEVSRLPLGGKVEIECIAAANS